MDPLEEYQSRLDVWRSQHGMLQRQFIQIGNWRLVLGIAEAALGWLAFGSHVVSAWVLLGPLIAFVALVVWHLKIIRRRTFAQRAIQFYERGLARLEDRWQGSGASGERFRDPAHPYSEDLDLFGTGSLFELVAAARTQAGEDTLAGWLLSATTRQEALARQQSVAELRSRLDLREQVALLGEDARAAVHVDATERWATAPAIYFHPMLRVFCLVFALAAIVAVIGFFAQALPLWPLLVIAACDFAIIFLLREKVARLSAVIDTPAQSLRIMSLLLQRLEEERFESPKLKRISADLNAQGLPASKRIARLEHWIDWLDSSDHLIVRIIRPILLWREQVVMGIETWRQHNGKFAVQWMKGIAEFEALSSFASLAFERPGWSFPALEESKLVWRGDALQHPLLASAKCVPNDVGFGDGLQLLIISGSNMSGKSTLLRSIGLNTVLAWAGAPVAARSLKVGCVQVATSMRVVDSLQDNRSRFYAEITRIRQIFDLLNQGAPVLFLLDELLSGTNSHDRLLGGVGIVRNLVDLGAIGLITTHDLALADMERTLGSRARNLHFDDRITENNIEFDYKLKPGVVTHSNALELMRAVGLNV